jgi:hypothetical protein
VSLRLRPDIATTDTDDGLVLLDEAQHDVITLTDRLSAANLVVP